jgi:hypothetical protein
VETLLYDPVSSGGSVAVEVYAQTALYFNILAYDAVYLQIRGHWDLCKLCEYKLFNGRCKEELYLGLFLV